MRTAIASRHPGAAPQSARLSTSRFAKPAGRVALVVTGLFVLAFIGRSAVAGAGATSPGAGPATAGDLTQPATALEPARAPPEAVRNPALSGAPPPVEAPDAPSATTASARASPDDPVVLNTATVDDLRRLPGIGPKRADAIVVLRSRLGRFRAIEDLLKVKGLGRATLRRLRPLVRLDAAVGTMAGPRDGGSPPVPTGPPPQAPWLPQS
ncbi:MAG: helix-hairpin-helix domain-containing protein [Polyangiaceae bacterium]|nr:helix-hairpin-helix domain-containing protein [Polyangiaceae bacterium]